MRRLRIVLAYLLVSALWACLGWMARDWYTQNYCSISATGTWECGK